jgi:hypothetical protein
MLALVWLMSTAAWADEAVSPPPLALCAPGEVEEVCGLKAQRNSALDEAVAKDAMWRREVKMLGNAQAKLDWYIKDRAGLIEQLDWWKSYSSPGVAP